MPGTTRIPFKPAAALLAALGLVAIGGAALEVASGATLAHAQTITPTYYTDVQPILEANCVTCHVTGGIAPFALDSGEQAVKWAGVIAAVTQSGYMPPWPPGGDSPAFLDDKRLGQASKQILQDWAKAGAPLGRRSPGQKP
jgi:mono/diheme cytochrome c family protein